jgi:hypothetical protein
MHIKSLTFVLGLGFLVAGCPRQKEGDFTLGEATQALEESSAATQAEGLSATSVDISTNFTIGQAVENAAAELRTFVESQLPCAEVMLEGATLTVEYGVNPGNCTYRGHTFSGQHSVTVARNEMNQVEVHHAWTDFSNGNITLNGTADVTWDFQALTRNVVHQSTWTNKKGRIGEGEGDRTQSLLPGGLAEGIQVDGSRSWSGERGEWDLAIDGVQMRWADPVPQAGSYTLNTPFKKTLSMSFSRVDEDTIRVLVAGPKKEFSFTVSKLGVVTSEGES